MERHNLHKSLFFTAAAAALVVASSCGRDANKWTVNGSITGADGKELIVETQTFVGWQGIDTVTLDASGKFAVSAEAKGYPAIYRLRVDGTTLYFPIDSIETLTIEGSLPGLDKNYTISGSDNAAMIMDVDRAVASAVEKMGPEKALADSALKRQLGNILLENPGSVVAYYTVSKQIGGQPIFSPTNRADVRVIGAVANAFSVERPNDPRTSQLSELYLASRREASQRADTIMAKEIGYHDITLYDNNGTRRDLSAMVDKSNLTLLNFTVYGSEESAAFNRALNAIYEKYRSRGLDIYQVAVDDDEIEWRAAAANIPWTTVRNAGAGAAQNLVNYYVTALPTTFIINGDGDLVERVDDVGRLQAAVAKYL